MQSLPNGTQLGPYTLLRLIARGGMGEVYEAYESQLQRRVALKIVAPTDPDEHDRDELVTRFLQEARTLARVNHPNVVTVYSIDSVNSVPFIAMEIVDGVSFKELLEDFVFSTDGAIPMFEQMLEGLKCLHENRIIHRDMKPHNLVLRSDGQVKILDFGIAKHVESMEHTRSGVVVGTVPYMPPEVRAGVIASARSDLWSLGAIFYECLTGRRLHAALQNYPQGGEQIFSPQEQTKIPEQMRDIIVRMTATRQLDRQENAAEVLNELRSFKGTRPPVRPEVWQALSKKVEELAKAKRKKNPGPDLSSLSSLRNASEGGTPRSFDRGYDIRTSLNSAHRSSSARKLKRTWRKFTKNLWPIAASVAAVAFLMMVWDREHHRSMIVPAPTPPPQVETAQTPEPRTEGRPATETRPTITDVHRPKRTLTLTEPVDQQLLWLEPTRIPTLAWSRPLNMNEYHIQIALDPRFRKVVIDEPVSGSSYRPGQVLADGQYYWQLKPSQTGLPVAGPQSFTVSLLEPVELVEPDPNHVFELPGREKSGVVKFVWTCKPSARNYRIQIASDPEFRALVHDEVVNGCRGKSIRLTHGTFYWRVRLEDVPEPQEYWSQPLQLALRSRETARPMGLAVPRLMNPVAAFTLSFRGKPRDVASISKNLIKAPVLSWRPVKGAREYLVQLSTTKDFSHLLSEETTASTRLEFRGAIPGKVYWRVLAHGRGSEASGYSARGQLNILLPTPQLSSSYKLSVASDSKEPAQLEWPSSPLADKYLVQISPTRDLAGAEEQVTRSPKLSMTGGPGKYYVRVAAADGSGQLLSAYSSLAEVNVESVFNLASPKPKTPPNGAHAPATNGHISIVFSWTKIPAAESYTLELSSDADFTKIISRHVSHQRGFLLKQAPLNGDVFWRVRSESNKGNSDWSPTSHFKVN